MTIKKLVLINTLSLGLAFSPLLRADDAAAPAQESKVDKKSDCEGECDCSKCKKGKDHKSCKKCQKHKHKEHHEDAAHGHEEAPKTDGK